MIFDSRPCDLGEGPVWHPGRARLYWFDILNRRLLSRGDSGAQVFEFPEMVSALGRISDDEAVVAAESGLLRVNLNDGSFTPLHPVAAGQPATRSNDGRADRQGGFWWGTMGRRGGADPGLGAVFRYCHGEVRRLFTGLTIPNAICFAADGRSAFFADTAPAKVWRVALDGAGWPLGEPGIYLDLAAEGLNPDGAVIGADGLFWNAQWGASRVAAYAPDGTLARTVAVPAPHASCPAFGGTDLSVLYVTTAREEMDAAALAACPAAGQTFAIAGVGRGLPEPQVLL
ncbi:MAG: SMP-30/gluconolactonase/LRE family protein [Rhodobacteraceae bacterium]|jgi:sugar lactone lactonase YvrE|nr:SMP-30/gluconolactonase/LRE family protein [Paracoccaceae bacterium]